MSITTDAVVVVALLLSSDIKLYILAYAYIRMNKCMYIYLCMYVCMYVCVCVCV